MNKEQLKQVNSLIKDQKWSEAEQEVQQILNKNENSSEAYAFLTDIYLKKKEFAAACESAQKTINTKPNAAKGYLLKAKAYLGLNNLRKASREFKAAFRLDPDSPDVYILKAKFSFMKEHWEDAYYSILQLSQEDQQTPEAQEIRQVSGEKLIERNLVVVRESYQQGILWRAEEFLRKNKTIDANHPENNRLLEEHARRETQEAREKLERGKFKTALIYAKSGLEKYPKHKGFQEIFEKSLEQVVEKAKEHFEAGEWDKTLQMARDGLYYDESNVKLRKYRLLANKELKKIRESGK
ncbi:Hypothetical protein PBC10988_19630 [Planctomycetales bacterium 10988]|nr:Hypothetical protein PBC10988_19630 [Planctomycetales bacterium 10988]